MRTRVLVSLSLLALIFSMSSLGAEDLEDIAEGSPTPETSEMVAVCEATDTAPQEGLSSPKSLEIEKYGGGCSHLDRCPVPLPSCNEDDDCLAHCAAGCNNPVCVRVIYSVCAPGLEEIELSDKYCNCY